MPVRDDIYSNVANSFLQTDLELAAALRKYQTATPFTDYYSQQQEEKKPIQVDEGSFWENLWRSLPINPYFWKSTEEKNRMLMEDWAKEHGVTSPMYRREGDPRPSMGPAPDDLGEPLPVLITEGVGEREGFSPAERFIGEWLMPSVIPGGVYRAPFSLAGKLLPKALTSSKFGKVTSKILDYAVGKLDDTRPVAARAAEGTVKSSKTAGKAIGESLAEGSLPRQIAYGEGGYIRAGQSWETVFRGEGPTSQKGGRYWSPSQEWAAQFTQTGKLEEVKKAYINKADIYEPRELPYAGDPDAIEAAVKEARQKGFKAVRLSEGGNEPNSIYVFNESALRKTPPAKVVREAPTPKEPLKGMPDSEPQMAPSTSVQTGLPGIGPEAAQSKMFEEANTAVGQGGIKSRLTEPVKRAPEEQQSFLKTESKVESVGEPVPEFSKKQFPRILKAMIETYKEHLSGIGTRKKWLEENKRTMPLEEFEREINFYNRREQFLKQSIPVLEAVAKRPGAYYARLKTEFPNLYRALGDFIETSNILPDPSMARSLTDKELAELTDILKDYRIPLSRIKTISRALEEGDLYTLELIRDQYPFPEYHALNNFLDNLINPYEMPVKAVKAEPALIQESLNTVSYPVDKIKVDPQRFQFKQGVDVKTGASSKLQDAKFNPDLAGRVYGWMDKEGNVWIVNGHHRLDLARRSGTKNIDIRIDKETDGVTAEMARAKGALMNIAEDQGTPLDVAKFLRDSGLDMEYLKQNGIAPSGRVASRGAALAQLDDSLFQKVVNGQLDEDSAVAIGAGLPGDFVNQREVAKIALNKELTPKELAALIKEAKFAGTTQVSQMTLFGESVEEKSLLMARAKLRAYIEDELARDRRLFGFVTSKGRPEALSKGGTTVDVAKGQELAQSSANAQTIFEAKVNAVGPINDIMNDAAARIVQGGDLNAIKRETLEAIKDTIATGKYSTPSRSGTILQSERSGGQVVQRPQPAIQQKAEPKQQPEVKPPVQPERIPEAKPVAQPAKAPEAKPAIKPEAVPELSPKSRVSPDDAIKMQAYLEKNKLGATQGKLVPESKPVIEAKGGTPEEIAQGFQKMGKPQVEPISGTATGPQARQAFENILTSPTTPKEPQTFQQAHSSISSEMQSLYKKLEYDLKSYKEALKGMKGEEAKTARKTIRLLEKELQNLQNILKVTSEKAALSTPKATMLRRMISTQRYYKGIPDEQYTDIKVQLTGKSSLTEMTEPQLMSVLDRIMNMRPVKIGNKDVITLKTEQTLQALNQSLIEQGKITSTTLSEIQHYLKLPTDRYISGRLFISESEGKQLIKALNQEAETGLTEWRNKVKQGMAKSPSLQRAYDEITSRIASAADPDKKTGVSSWWDMGKYMYKLQERTNCRIGDLWKRAYDRFLENGVRLTNLDNELEAIPGFKKIANDQTALKRINDYIASKNRWMQVEYPADITPDEIKVAQKIEEQLLKFVDDVRYYRFHNAYTKYDGDITAMSKEIPDAPLMDLNEGVKIYESQGADALMKYLKTKTWGVIESGYEPHIAVNPRLQLQKIKSDVVSKGRLQPREGVEFDPGDLNILQRREKYIKQMLNLNLEPYFKAMDREFQQISHKLKNPDQVAANISQAFNELKGYSPKGDIVNFLGKAQGYAFSVLALAPHMTFRNSLQNFLHPDVLAFLNPKNRKFTGIDKKFFETFISQEQGVTRDYLMQASLGKDRLSQLVQRLSYYGKAETYANRIPAFWASLNKAERALEKYRETGNIQDFIKGSSLDDLTLSEQKHVLELLSQDSVSYGIEGLENISGGQAAVWETARGITEKTHFNYIRAGRAPVEQGAMGRTWLSLATYPRNIVTRLYEDALKIKNGTLSEKLRAAKTLTSFIVGALAADQIYKAATGKDYDQYNPLQVLTYGPGGLAAGTVEAISEPVNTIVRAIGGDKDALHQLPSQITRAGDLFIPFYKPTMDLVDALSNQKDADREAVRFIRNLLDKNYKYNPRSNDVKRAWYQKVQKILFGGGDPEPENQLQKYLDQWTDDFKVYESIPTDPIELKARKSISREEYRRRNPAIDAKLFITGQVSTVQTLQAANIALQLIQENNIDPDIIPGIKENKAAQEKMKELGVRDTRITPTDSLVRRLPAKSSTALNTPQQKWQAIRNAGGYAAAVAFDKVWYKNQPLTEEETRLLQDLYKKYPLDAPDFNTWLKQRVRQIFESTLPK